MKTLKGIGAMILTGLAVQLTAQGAEIWNGQRITFSKTNYADWTQPANQDVITPAVALTRKDDQGLFNIAAEAGFGSGSPADTEWAFGTTVDLPLTFSSWRAWNGSSPPDAVGLDAVLHLISDDIYIDIKMTSWTSGEDEGGGGFSYERASGTSTLEIDTASLPSGMERIPYSHQLEATNGVAPFTWHAKYSEQAAINSFSEVGFPQDWHADDQTWQLDLPFNFPFFGQQYTNCWVDSNGLIRFDGSGSDFYPSMNEMIQTPMIAVLWGDLWTKSDDDDIRIERGSDHITIHWDAAYYSGGAPVNISATLYKNGTIRLCYGEGNGTGGMIGISAGDHAQYLLSAKSESGSMENAPDIIFATELPEGLTCSTNGLVAGTPMRSGTNQISFVVVDSAGDRISKELELIIDPNPNTRPVISSSAPPTGTFYISEETSQLFTVSATDPEGTNLVYTWTWNGMPVGGNTSSYTLTTVFGDEGFHGLRCAVSDGFWTNTVCSYWDVEVFRGFPNGQHPLDLVVSTNVFERIDLCWTDPFTIETGYRIERAPDAGFTNNLATFDLGVDATNYSDHSVVPGENYYYRVVALNEGELSDWSLVASALAKAFPEGVAPGNLTVFPVDTLRIALSWQDPFSTETGFRIERSSDISFTNDVTIFTAGMNVTSYTDRIVIHGTNCYYRIAAMNGSRLSDYSLPVLAVNPYGGGTLMVYYNFEGNFNDYPGAGVHADYLVTVTGGMLTNDVPAGAKGSTQSYYVDNNISHQTAQTDAWSHDLAAYDDYTIMFWIKADSELQNNSNIRTISMKSKPDGSAATEPAPQVGGGWGPGNPDKLDLRFIDSVGGDFPKFSPEAAGVIDSDGNPANDVWHHVAFIASSSGVLRYGHPWMETYIDGVYAGFIQYPSMAGHPLGNADGELIIGGHNLQNRSMTGYLDDIAIFSEAVAASNILAIANGTKSPADFARKNVDLQLSKTANTANLLTETNLTYTITVTNSGAWAADGVEVVDVMPDEVTFLNAVPAAIQTNGNEYTFALVSLMAGEVGSIEVNVISTSPVPCTIINVASVTSTDFELIDANNQDSAQTLVPDTDGDSIVDWMEAAVYGSNPSNPDSDGDGMRDPDELRADTDLLDADSVLAFTGLSFSNSALRLEWTGGTSVVQYIESRGNLLDADEVWVPIYTNIPPTHVINAVLHEGVTNNCLYYRITVPSP